MGHTVKVAQHLWFEKDMESAVRFYTSFNPGCSIGWISTIPANSPSGPTGSVMLASFKLGDHRYKVAALST
ncbi:MAG: VOC family protein [Rhodomicrobium sp.]